MLRPMEGDQIFGAAAREMCLVSGLVIPAKFKTPNLDQYEGATCPKSHLIMYYRKMAAHVDNDKLMIHCFQDSLKGASSKWYLTLDQTRICCFQDLSDAFIKQYKYNMDLAPDRRQLLSIRLLLFPRLILSSTTHQCICFSFLFFMETAREFLGIVVIVGITSCNNHLAIF